MSFGSESFVYDAMGNPTTYRGMTCTWEKGRQLKSMTSAAGTATFTYDGTGLRKSKTVGNETTSYVYENGRLLRQTGTKTLDFIYGSEGVIGFKIGTASYLYRKNLFGDVTEIYNEAGTLVGKYSYTAFGACTVELDTDGIATENPIRYRSYYYDDETEPYYLKSRYYDPEVGRFITIDDISYLDPESINGLNLYAYCGNNPVMRVDENGTDWLHWVLGALLVIGLTLVTAGIAHVALAGLAISKAVTTGIMIGGLIAGGGELIGQGLTSNWQTIDYGALAIETFTGVAYGALAAVGASATSSLARIAIRGARVSLSGLNTVLHGINNGDSFGKILVDTVTSITFSAVLQGGLYGLNLFRGYTTTSNIMAIALEKNMMFGIKEMFLNGAILAGKSIWKHYDKDILNIIGAIYQSIINVLYEIVRNMV